MKATGNDRTNFQPMSELYETIDLHWEFSPEEFRNIEMGRVPLEMGDRFFIFMEDNCLYINPAMSGECLYMLWFEQQGDHFVAYKLRITKDPAVVRITDNKQERKRVIGILMDSLRVPRTRNLE
jgi:hypothetical protein